MTHINNFNTNSNGDDIDLTAYYDTQQSRWYFDDSIAILQSKGYRATCKAFYIGCGNLPDPKDIEFKLVATDEQKKQWLEREYNETPPPLEDAEDLILDSYGEQVSLLNYLDFSEQIAPMHIEPEKRVEWLQITGYSQGDYAEVAYCPDDIMRVWGVDTIDETALKREVKQLFYDAPIYCIVKVNGVEHFYSEYMPDCYEWDKELFASKIKENTGCNILEMLPATLDYI